MKIVVGTTSEQKLEYLKELLGELQIEADIFPLEVASEISDQPKTSKETKRGSVNRAKNALMKHQDADAALGIEVGYHPNWNGDYKILCWATIIDNSGRQVSAKSHSMLLPQFHQRYLKEDKYLGDYVRQYLIENPDPITQEFGMIIRNRKPFIQTSIRLVLFEYLCGENNNLQL